MWVQLVSPDSPSLSPLPSLSSPGSAMLADLCRVFSRTALNVHYAPAALSLFFYPSSIHLDILPVST